MGMTFPHSLGHWSQEAEAAVLGSMLIQHTCLGEVTAQLIKEDFYDARHRLIYSTITEMAHRGVAIDLVTVYESLRSKPQNEECNVSDLTALCEAVPSVTNLSYYLSIVKCHAIQRRKLQAAARVHQGTKA